MLEALSYEEKCYYSSESNVVQWAGKSSVIFKELDDHFGFVGGEVTEYVAYFNRADLPSQMWTFLLPHQVKAVGGFSTVAKKNGKLRKLLMSCAAFMLLMAAKHARNMDWLEARHWHDCIYPPVLWRPRRLMSRTLSPAC
jgi:hypothetical protein